MTDQKPTTARLNVYVEVELSGGQKFVFDVPTAQQLRRELDLALRALGPDQVAAEKTPNP